MKQELSLYFKKQILDDIMKEGSFEVIYGYNLSIRQVMDWFFELKMNEEDFFRLAMANLQKCEEQYKEIHLLKLTILQLQNQNQKISD
jgi:hypothetical protein